MASFISTIMLFSSWHRRREIATEHYARSFTPSVLYDNPVRYVPVFSSYRWRSKTSKKWLTLSSDKVRKWGSWDLWAEITLILCYFLYLMQLFILSNFNCQMHFKKKINSFSVIKIHFPQRCIFGYYIWFPKDVYLDILIYVVVIECAIS